MIEIKIDSEKRSWFIVFLLAVAVVAVYKLLDNLDFIFGWIGGILSIMSPFFAALLIACILNSPCKKLEKFIGKAKWKFVKKRARLYSVLFVYAVLVGILTLAIRSMVPTIKSNMEELVHHLPEYWDAIVGYINNWFGNDDVSEFMGNFSVTDAIGWFNLGEINVAQGVMAFTSGVFSAILAIIASIYMLLDKERLMAGVYRAVAVVSKKSAVEKLARYANRVNEIFSKYIFAQLLDSIIIGTLCTIVLLLMEVQYAVFLGFIIGLSNMIPYFGSIITGIITALITMVTGGVIKGIWVAVALLILQQIDGNIIGPKLVGSTLNIRPIGILVALTIGGGLFGIIGMFLAAPAFAIIKAIIMEYMVIFEEKKTSRAI